MSYPIKSPAARPVRPPVDSSELVRVFRRECGGDPVLRSIGAELVRTWPEDASSVTPKMIVEEVLVRAHDYYLRLWAPRSKFEKLAMLQLAQEGVVNPHCEEALRVLVAKGLVKQDPNFLLMNESFRLFLLRVPNRADVLAVEQEGENLWSSLRGTVWVGLIVLTAFVAMTQQQVLQGFEAALPLVGGGLTAAGKLYDLMKTAWASPGKTAQSA